MLCFVLMAIMWRAFVGEAAGPPTAALPTCVEAGDKDPVAMYIRAQSPSLSARVDLVCELGRRLLAFLLMHGASCRRAKHVGIVRLARVLGLTGAGAGTRN